MRQLMYTIFDEKAEVYLPPFFVPTEGIAERAFDDCINSNEHQFSKHPHDYTLFYLAEFNQDDGTFGIQDRKLVGNGVEYLKLKQDSDNVTPPDTPVLSD